MSQAHGRIIPLVSPTPLNLDTAAEIEERQVEAWRRMSPAEKLSLAASMTMAVRELALAGVRQRYPDASPREQFLRLAILTLGKDLAGKVYPDAGALDDE